MSTPVPAHDERPPSLFAGAALGARVGVLFAALEAISASWLTRATVDGLEYTQQSAASFVLSVVLHGAIGSVAGALASVSAARLARRIERPASEVVARLSTLGVLAALGALQAHLLPNRAIEIRQSAGLAVLFALAILVSLAGPRTGRWLAGIASPWTAALAFACVPWLASHLLADQSWQQKQVGALVAVLFLLALAVILRKRIASARAVSAGAVGATLIAGLAGALVPQSALDVAATPAPPGKGPDVIVISLDTVRADHLSLYGYERETTPFLRDLAHRAVLFEHAYSAGDFTLSSHASLFTGQYPLQHGARPDPDRSVPQPLGFEATTLAEILAQHGWATSAVAANCVLLAPHFGLAQGFEHYDARYRSICFPRAARWTLRGWLHEVLHDHLPPHEFDLLFRGAAEINREVFAELDRRDTSRPLFLFVNYMDAHAPYRPPPPYDKLYDPAARPMRMEAYRQSREDVYRGTAALPAADRDGYVAHYDGALNYLDAQLRVLFERLMELGLYENSLIIVTADHGEAFGEHGTMEHGMSVYQEQVRVPLLIKRPGSDEGRKLFDVASGVDLVPTVLAELGIEAPPGLPGRALFAPDGGGVRLVFSEHYPTEWHTARNKGRAIHHTAALGERFALIRGDDGRAERFDLDADPREEHPLAALPEGFDALAGPLQPWIAPRRATRKGEQRTEDMLQMLGYGK